MEINSPIDILESEIRRLEEEIEPTLRKIDGYRNAINLFKSQQLEPVESVKSTTTISTQTSDYPITGDAFVKIGFAVNFYGRFVHAQDVKKLIQKYEKDAQAKQFLKTLSQKLYKCVQRGMLSDIQYNKSKHHTFYGKKEWLTEVDGKAAIIRGHEPSSEFIKNIDQSTLIVKRM